MRFDSVTTLIDGERPAQLVQTTPSAIGLDNDVSGLAPVWPLSAPALSGWRFGLFPDDAWRHLLLIIGNMATKEIGGWTIMATKGSLVTCSLRPCRRTACERFVVELVEVLEWKLGTFRWQTHLPSDMWNDVWELGCRHVRCKREAEN